MTNTERLNISKVFLVPRFCFWQRKEDLMFEMNDKKCWTSLIYQCALKLPYLPTVGSTCRSYTLKASSPVLQEDEEDAHSLDEFSGGVEFGGGPFRLGCQVQLIFNLGWFSIWGSCAISVGFFFQDISTSRLG